MSSISHPPSIFGFGGSNPDRHPPSPPSHLSDLPLLHLHPEQRPVWGQPVPCPVLHAYRSGRNRPLCASRQGPGHQVAGCAPHPGSGAGEHRRMNDEAFLTSRDGCFGCDAGEAYGEN